MPFLAPPAVRPFLAVLLAIALAGCSRGPSVHAPTTAALPGEAGARDRNDPPVRRAPPPGPRPKYVGALDTAVTAADLDSLWVHQIIVPVEGMLRKSVRDDYGAPRAGRPHRALDLLAPKGTPVLAADDCVIGRLLKGPIGGTVIYATDPSGQFVFYYAHLDRYRRGLAVGDRVAKGSLIGYVGSTGNALPSAPHLHFQIMKRGVGRAWWDGPPINPFSFFSADRSPLPTTKRP